ncbi:helix-turn-helix domain-containing protein [Exiguobacterium artemiae]|uniref:helix-turn-helix domain-containing protein n=1 Tax=Exiguobacterium artemiae TaxID=340145 RepID=UPI00047DE342|nr:helix-turn-helix domain-containing protein [Exiguobacterium sibiricum]
MQPYLRVEHQLLRDGAAFTSVHEKMVYLLLQSYAGRDGLAFPSHQTLADAVPCGKTTVKNCLQTLTEKGWIEKAERFDRHGGQTSNGYRIRTVSPDTSRQDPGQETATGETPVDTKEKGVKKQSLKKEPPSLRHDLTEIIHHFETEIGRVTPSIRRQLETLLKETSPAVLHHAIEQATAANIRNFNYIKVIINSLKQRNLLTQEQIEMHETRRRTSVARSSRRKGHGKLPDWVERERRQQQQAEAEQKQRFEQTVPDQGELAVLLAELI